MGTRNNPVKAMAANFRQRLVPGTPACMSCLPTLRNRYFDWHETGQNIGAMLRAVLLALAATGAVCGQSLNAQGQDHNTQHHDTPDHNRMGGIYDQPESPAQCWPAAALRGTPADKAIRKSIPQAVVAPPQGDPLPYPPLASRERGAIRRVDLPKGNNRIALTFDLCEQPDEISGYDSAIVNYLRQENVKATFFTGGKWFLTHKDRAQQLIADPLFEMGNHAWEHRNLRVLSGDTLVNEIKYTQLAYEHQATELAARQCLARDGQKFSISDTNKRLFLFRFPFGACNAAALDAVAQQGLLSIQWDVSSGDPSKGASAALIAAEVLRHVRAGSIVLFHANGRGWNSAEALPILIPKLRAAGFKFATVTELLYASGAKWDVRPICFDGRPNDTDRYDDLARKLDIRFREFTARFAKRAAPAAAAPLR